jgi:tripartite-type tricarboxylate transporter receptor subunit TctC
VNGEIVKILAVPEMHKRLVALGFEPVGNSPAEFAAYIKAEIAKWAKVIKAAGIKAE